MRETNTTPPCQLPPCQLPATSYHLFSYQLNANRHNAVYTHLRAWVQLSEARHLAVSVLAVFPDGGVWVRDGDCTHRRVVEAAEGCVGCRLVVGSCTDRGGRSEHCDRSLGRALCAKDNRGGCDVLLCAGEWGNIKGD